MDIVILFYGFYKSNDCYNESYLFFLAYFYKFYKLKFSFVFYDWFFPNEKFGNGSDEKQKEDSIKRSFKNIKNYVFKIYHLEVNFLIINVNIIKIETTIPIKIMPFTGE